MLNPSDILAAKLLVQLKTVNVEQARAHLRALAADEHVGPDLVARVARDGLLNPVQLRTIRHYVALFEHIFREAVFLRQLERRGLAKDEVYDLLARAELDPHRRALGRLLVEAKKLPPDVALEVDEATRRVVAQQDREVLVRYRRDDFEGVARPLLPVPHVTPAAFSVATIFRTEHTRGEVAKRRARLSGAASSASGSSPGTRRTGRPTGRALGAPHEDPSYGQMPSLDPDGEMSVELTVGSSFASPPDTVEDATCESGVYQVSVLSTQSVPQSADTGAFRVDLGADNERLAALEEIGPYRIVECLGQGGMGAVFLGEAGLGQFVAIKVLLADEASAEDLRRFEREAHIHSLLDHPNTVRLIAAGATDDGLRYIVIPPYASTPLRERLKARDLQPREQLEVARQLAAGLGGVHAAGVVHRDVKPENTLLLVGDPLRVKLVDFGVARLLAAEANPFETAAGAISGSPAYIAPETLLGEACCERTDLYSYGIVLFETLTYRLPFVGRTPVDFAREHLIGAPLTLREARPADWPPAVCRLIDGLLEKKPEDRPASAAEVQRDLAALTPELLATLEALSGG